MKRRFFLFAAPAIVAASSLMPISSRLLRDTGPWMFDNQLASRMRELFEQDFTTDDLHIRIRVRYLVCYPEVAAMWRRIEGSAGA